MKPHLFLFPIGLLLLLSLTVSCDRQASPPAPEATVDPSAALNLQLEIQKEMLALERERLQADRDAALAEAANARDALNQAKTERALAEAQARAAQAEKALAEVRAEEANARAENLAAENAARDREAESRPEPELPERPRVPSFPPIERDETYGPDYSLFYRELAPHGPWFQTAEYGYVWQPEIARRLPQWRPYTDGRWLDTNQGWAWWSEEPFGWATYHYGRWTEVARIGWIWVPGPDWAPAWVSWRVSNDYIGWAPLPPITVYETTFNYGSRTDSACGIPPHHYNFVPTGFFAEPARSHTLPPAQNVTIIEETTNVTNIHIHEEIIMVEGPRPEPLRQRFGSLMPRHELSRQEWNAGARLQDRPEPRQNGGRLDFLAPRVAPASVEQAKPSLLGGIIEQLLPAHTASQPDPGLVQNFVRERARQNSPNNNKKDNANPAKSAAPKPSVPAAPVAPKPAAGKGKGKEKEKESPASRPGPDRPRPGDKTPAPAREPQRPMTDREERGEKGNPPTPPQPSSPLPEVQPRPTDAVPVPPMPATRPQGAEEEGTSPTLPPATPSLPAPPAAVPMPVPVPETVPVPEKPTAPASASLPVPATAPSPGTDNESKVEAEPPAAAMPGANSTEPVQTVTPLPAEAPFPGSVIPADSNDAGAKERPARNPKGKSEQERKEKERAKGKEPGNRER
jgi:hypothetical protein